MPVCPRVSDQKHRVSGERRSPAQLDRFPEPPPEGALRDDPESQPRAAPSDRAYPRPPRDRPLPRNPDSKSRGSVPQEEAAPAALRAPSQPRPERRRRSEGVPSHSPWRDAGREDKRRASHEADNSRREPPLPPPPPPYGSTPSTDPAGQLRPPMDGPHPPCPHPVPQRLVDQPPASALHDAPSR